jgi:hypothetical protein
MNNKDTWTDYTNADGVIRWTVDYYQEGLIASHVECNNEDALECAQTEFEDFKIPTTDIQVSELSARLAARAEVLYESATDLSDDETAVRFFRRARIIEQAAKDLDYSGSSAIYFQQEYGDAGIREMEEMLEAWDETYGDRSYSNKAGCFISASNAWERARHNARNGGSRFELVANADSLTLESGGYQCDISDIKLRVIDATIADVARLNWDGDIQPHELDLLESAPVDGLAAALSMADGYFYTAATEFADAAKALAGLSEQDIARVAETVNVLRSDWTGNFDALIKAAVNLTIDSGHLIGAQL